MQPANTQPLLDRLAISASALCLLHCLATPLLLVALPVLSSTFMADERFHRFMVVCVLPVSVLALLIGCRRHRDALVLGLGGLGLLALVTGAFFGGEWLGESGEKVATVASGLVLAAGHFRNFRLCRHDRCEH